MIKKMITCLICCFVLGCGVSQKTAQQSYDKGTSANDSVRSAFFVKGWGLNKALITESRQKFLAQAQLEVAKNSPDGKVDMAKVEEVLRKFESELGQDEVVTSENFAYLSFLMLMGERADNMLDNVDIFVESKKPIWKHLSETTRIGIADVEKEYEAWKPLIRDMAKYLQEYQEQLRFDVPQNPSTSN